MMKKTLKLASLTFLMFGCVVASEFRPPLSADRGPQRLDMNLEHDADSNWDLEMYSVGYSRDANKSFTKHGMNTAPLSTLIFGQDNFKLSDALTAAIPVDQTKTVATGFSEKFNANLASQAFFPRVTYSETGVNFGGKVGYRVWDGKGMVGLKVNVPLKTVRMERDDNAETAELGSSAVNSILADVRNVNIPANSNGGLAAANAHVNVFTKDINTLANMYKLSAVQNLPFIRNGQIDTFLKIPTNGGGPVNNAVLGGTEYLTAPGVGAVPTVGDFGGVAERGDIPFVLIYNPDNRLLPSTGARAVKMVNTLNAGNRASGAAALEDITLCLGAGAGALLGVGVGGLDGRFTPYAAQGAVLASGGATTPTVLANLTAANGPASHVSAIATDIVKNGALVAGAANVPFAPITLLDNTTANFAPNTIYSFRGLMADADAQTTKNLINANIDNLWLMTVADATGAGLVGAGQVTALESLFNRYTVQSAEQWLWANGYILQNNQRTGLGDITINPCYDHSFSAAWQGGVYAHVLIPTGGSRKGGENPYKARLGNDNHVELGGGANVAWQALDWMNIRLDAMAAYAMPAKERVTVPFKGSKVKAVGPAMDADIDYTRVKASVDTTLVHPKASSLATTIGYDFEFKTKDNVSLKDKAYTFKTMANDKNSWFGGFWNNTAGAFVDQKVELDANVLSKNTERISHNIRVESSWHATEKLSLFWGGSAPIAGQHVAKMSSIYGGMNVKY